MIAELGGNMLTESEVLQAIGAAIEDPNFNRESTTENTENWDSLGVLSIFATLSKLTSGKSDQLPQIVNIESAQELMSLLRENHLVQ
jgi:hypothetical protein